jgi:hypothetical protein
MKRLLASAFHFPVAARGIVYESADPTRYVEVHPALRVSFIGPGSGRVLVSIGAAGGGPFSLADTYWALRETDGRGSGRVVPGSERYMYGGEALKQYQDAYDVVVDVKPGRPYRWTFAHKPGKDFPTMIKVGHPDTHAVGHGPIILEVWDTGWEARQA